METLKRLALLVPVQANELVSAQQAAADPRPWFRLAPHGSGLRVTLRVYPLGPGGPESFAGEGATTVIGRIHRAVVQTHRDLPRERSLADAAVLATGVLEEHGGADDTWLLKETEACLTLVSALQAQGDSVHVEWPQGTPLKLRGKARRRALGGRIRMEGGILFARGALQVDEALSVELDELLALVADRPGRFVRLDNGDYLELEQELRATLDAMAAARVSTSQKGEVALPINALGAVTDLTGADYGFGLDAEAMAWRHRLVTAFETKHDAPRSLEAELRDYQYEGFCWLARLAELDLGACLADDMGLGKTVQILALLLHQRRAGRGQALVVAPTSVCENWRREIERFAPSLRARPYLGAGREREIVDLSPDDVVLTSYPILQQDAEVLQSLRFGTAVLDEAQLIKNAESLRAKAALGLNARMRVAATGTPVENHLGDLYSVFRFVMPSLVGSWAKFAERFGGDVQADATRTRALRRLIQPFVLRRTKAQVLDDLPPLTEIQRTVTLSGPELQLYEAVRRTAVAKLNEVGESAVGRVQVLAEITRLRRICCHPRLADPSTDAGSSKLACFVELMEELTQGRHRALVFSQFVDMLALVRELCVQRGVAYQYLDGSTPAKQRTAAVDAFQAGDGDVFLISLRAGGFGLNLTAADYVIHLDPWWNPAVEAQASDRAHRLGQIRPVTVYRLVTAGTVEERIVELHRRKRDLADSLLEGAERVATLSAGELRDLLSAD
jgi:superfamily II DNA or RNA helicase